jgi:signal recognition particle receptor subunit beta
VYYNASRKLILKGVDGVIFVADSQAERMEANIEAMHNLYENLDSYGYDLTTIPFAMQYNKRDLPNAMAMADLRAQLNPHGSARLRGSSDRGHRGFRDAGCGQQDGRSGP